MWNSRPGNFHQRGGSFLDGLWSTYGSHTYFTNVAYNKYIKLLNQIVELSRAVGVRRKSTGLMADLMSHSDEETNFHFFCHSEHFKEIGQK